MSNVSDQSVAHAKPMPQVVPAPMSISTISTPSSESNAFSGNKSQVKYQSTPFYKMVNVNINGVHKQLLVPVASSTATEKSPASSAVLSVSAVASSVSSTATISPTASVSSNRSLLTKSANTRKGGASPSITPSAQLAKSQAQTLLLQGQPTAAAVNITNNLPILSHVLATPPNMRKSAIENRYGSADSIQTFPIQTPEAGKTAQLVQLPDGRFFMHGVQVGAKVVNMSTKDNVLSKLGANNSNMNSFVVTSNSGQMVPMTGMHLLISSDALKLQDVNQASIAGSRVATGVTASKNPMAKPKPSKTETMCDNVPTSEGGTQTSIHKDSSYSFKFAPDHIKHEQPAIIEIIPEETDDPQESVLCLAQQADVMNRNSELDQKFSPLPDPIIDYTPEHEATVSNALTPFSVNTTIPTQSTWTYPKTKITISSDPNSINTLQQWKNVIVGPTGKKTVLQPTKGEQQKDDFLKIKTNAGTFLVPVNSSYANTSSTMIAVNSNSGPIHLLAPVSETYAMALPKSECVDLSTPSVSTSAPKTAKKRMSSESLDKVREEEHDLSGIEEHDQLTVSTPTSSITNKVENPLVKRVPSTLMQTDTSKAPQLGSMDRILLLKAKLQKQREEAELASKKISASRKVMQTFDI